MATATRAIDWTQTPEPAARAPTTSVGHTVVVCRRNQVREASIVLSCVAGAGMPMLLVLDDPPATFDTYAALHARFETLRQETQAARHGETGFRNLAGTASLDDAAQLALLQRQREARAQLAPYRSWLKRSHLLGQMLRQMKPQRLVYLFAPHHDLLHPWSAHAQPAEAGAAGLIPEVAERWALVPAGMDWPAGLPAEVRHYSGLQSLYDTARAIWCSNLGAHDYAAVAAQGSAGCYAVALVEALHRGVPLRPLEGLVQTIEQACLSAHAMHPATDLAVLVEDRPDALCLLAALHAWQRCGRIVAVPPPDQRAVAQAIEAVHRAVNNDALARLRMVSLQSPQQAQPETLRRIAELEAAVSAHVDPWVLRAVGDRALSAFTQGTPYTFVHRDGVLWHRKAIGHLAADADLLVYGELLGEQAAGRPYAMNLVFDPGEFHRNEAAEVVQHLAEKGTHTLSLWGDEASRDALLQIGNQAPLDTVFFITHGSDNAIQLGGELFQRTDIPQWLTLDSRPVIFNNSCQSWTGVGQEFVRAGARAYIGTLWAVQSEAAIARAVAAMPAMAEGLALAEALRAPESADPSQRAYIVVGTATVRRPGGRAEPPAGLAGYAEEGACAMLEVLRGLRTDRAHLRALWQRLWREYRQMTQLLESAGGGPDELARVLPRELALMSPGDRDGPAPAAEVSVLYRRCLHALEAAHLTDAERQSRLSQLHEDAADQLAAAGDLEAALQATADGIAAAQAGQASPANLMRARSDILKPLGRWKEAIESAKASLDYSRAHDERQGALGSLGRLAQLYKRTGDIEAALRACDEGITQARVLREKSEEAAFHLDRGNLLARTAPEQAHEAALQAERLWAGEGDYEAALAAHGLIGQCKLLLGRHAQAREHIQLTIAEARRLGNRRREMLLFIDLAAACQHLGERPQALALLEQSSALARAIGATESVLAGLHLRCNLLAELHDWPAFERAAVDAVACLPEDMAHGPLVGGLVHALYGWLDMSPAPLHASALHSARTLVRQQLAAITSPSRLALLLVYVLDTACAWADGEAAAADMSRQLDGYTDGVFGLEGRFGRPLG